MSRSYKHNYRCKDHSKGQKQKANQKVRNGKNKYRPLKGNDYKKLYPQWDICDWNYQWTKEEAIQDWYEEEADHYRKKDGGNLGWRHEKFKTLERWLNYWEKCVRRK